LLFELVLIISIIRVKIIALVTARTSARIRVILVIIGVPIFITIAFIGIISVPIVRAISILAPADIG
jgi:hypothetical protein